MLHLGRRRLRRRPRRAARLPPLARQARHGHRGPPAGPLRPPGARGRPCRRSSPRSRRPARAGSTAPSSSSSPRSSTTSTATTTQWEREPLERLAKRRPADGLPALRLLAVHGHAPRQEAAGGAVGQRRRALEDLESERMRVLVTGHDGYIGTVLVPLLPRPPATRSSGSTAYLFADVHLRRGRGADVPALRKDIRDVDLARPRGLRRRRAPGRALQRPARRPEPATHLRHQPPRRGHRRASAAKAAGVARFLFSSSCSLYGAARRRLLDETADFNPVTPYGESKVLVGAGHRAAGRRRLQPDLPAQRHRLRRLGPPARRPRGEQPRRLRLHHRRGAA